MYQNKLNSVICLHYYFLFFLVFCWILVFCFTCCFLTCCLSCLSPKHHTQRWIITLIMQALLTSILERIPELCLTPQLNEKNYHSWSRNMMCVRCSLLFNNKLKFANDNLDVSDREDYLYEPGKVQHYCNLLD